MSELDKLINDLNFSLENLDLKKDLNLDKKLIDNQILHISNIEELPKGFRESSYGISYTSNSEDSFSKHKILLHKEHGFYYREASSDTISITSNYRTLKNKNFYDFLNVDSSDVILDLGGYIGLFAKTSMEKGARVISYEPDIEACTLFKLNSTATVHNLAITNQSYDSKTYYVYNWYIMNSLYNVVNEENFHLIKEYNVNTIPFKEALEEYEFNTIKCDIMGEELTLDWTLPNNIKKVCICFYPYKIPLGYILMYNIITHLTKQGYMAKNLSHTIPYKQHTTTAFNLFFHKTI